MGASLLLAISAEFLDFFAPETLLFKGTGMALAAAIWLADFSTYRKGFTALRQGRLNISALMTVAITGAFLIGQGVATGGVRPFGKLGIGFDSAHG
ncbi:MAG: hypothetical protein O9312_13315 [Hylemonella sp.]|jgi:Cd2+/Zn2+-exporting ATPase|nr:hypothetical protein [Hylemonella sp.]